MTPSCICFVSPASNTERVSMSWHHHVFVLYLQPVIRKEFPCHDTIIRVRSGLKSVGIFESVGKSAGILSLPWKLNKILEKCWNLRVLSWKLNKIFSKYMKHCWFNLHFICSSYSFIRSVVPEASVKAGPSNYIPQILWDVITCPCPGY